MGRFSVVHWLRFPHWVADLVQMTLPMLFTVLARCHFEAGAAMNCAGRRKRIVDGFKTWSRLAGICLFVGVVSHLSTQRAQASCGDYVKVGGNPSHPQPAMVQVPSPLLRGFSPQPLWSSVDQHRLPFKPIDCPCSGPNCSNGSVPPSSPPASTSFGGQQWLCHVMTLTPPWPVAAEHVAAYQTDVQVRSPRTIFRPPRS